MSDMSEAVALQRVHLPQFGKTDGAAADAIPQLVAALAKASEGFEEVSKDQEGVVNPKDSSKAGYKFKYAALAAYVQATRPSLAANGLIVTSHLSEAEDGAKIVHTYLMHASGGFMFSSMAVPRIGDGYISQIMQAFGGAVSYIRRYLYIALLNLVCDDEDIDAEGVGDGVKGDMQTNKAAAAFPKHPDITKAKTIGDLSRVMTAFEKADKGKYRFHFEARQIELRAESGEAGGEAQ
jgi:hypothetical protein